MRPEMLRQAIEAYRSRKGVGDVGEIGPDGARADTPFGSTYARSQVGRLTDAGAGPADIIGDSDETYESRAAGGPGEWYVPTYTAERGGVVPGTAFATLAKTVTYGGMKPGAFSSTQMTTGPGRRLEVRSRGVA